MVTQTSGGNYAWNTAPSGTAGNAISFTQAMTLNASGNLGIGSSTIFNGGGFGKVISLYDATAPAISLVNASKQWQLGVSGTNFTMYDVNNFTNVFMLNGSTGAATFSTSATTALSVISSATASGLQLKNTGTTASDWIIQSDGGVVSGQAALRFYSITASAYRMSIDGSGNVGIGTTAPSVNLDVRSSSVSTPSFIAAGNSDISKFISIYGGTSVDAVSAIWWKNGQSLKLATATSNNGASESIKMIITDGGNVGIGETPTSSIGWARILTLNGNNVGDTAYILKKTGSAQEIAMGTDGAGCYHDIAGAASASNNNHIFRTGGTNSSYSVTERMRITSGGDVFIGCTSDPNGSTNGIGLYPNGEIDISRSSGSSAIFNRNTTTGTIVDLRYNNSVIGTISTNGTNASYNTSSDYRLKQDYKDYSGLDLVNKIKTYDYEWKADKSRGYGVIAHELQSVINYAVTGVKDGKEMQGVDYSKIVPVLIKSIQELKAELETLKNK